MKGLIRQDLVILFTKESLYLICFLALLLVVFACTGLEVFAITLPAVIVVRFGISSFQYDSKSQWGKFACTLPLSRRKIVMARYGTAIGLSLIGLCASVLYAVVVHFVLRTTFDRILAAIFCAFAATLLFVAVNFPVLYRLGAERASIFTSLFSVVVYMLLALVFGFLPISKMVLAFSAISVLAIACFIVSFCISVRIYTEKDIS